MDITIDEVSLGASEIYRDMLSFKIAWQGNDDDEIEDADIISEAHSTIDELLTQIFGSDTFQKT